MKSWLLALALCCAPFAQEKASQERSFQPSRLERVVVMGASLSAGFGAERPFVAVVEASLRGKHQPPLDLGDPLFFTSPLQIGAQQASSALDAEPTLLIALDFLFWFGYGTNDAKGAAIKIESQRLELLERGLKLLEEFECPLVIGDFPDMSAAVGKMLSPEQMPQVSTLPLLSKRVREWAATRKNTFVLPLSEVVLELHSEGEVTIGRHTFPNGSKLLQPDQLHPTLEGLVAVAQLACDQLITAKLARPEDFELELSAVLGKLRKGQLAPAGASKGTPR